MNSYCRNCGEKLENDIKMCPKCGAEVFEKRINIEKKKIELDEYRKKENKYILIIITLYTLSYLLSYLNNNFISYITPLLSLSSTIILVYARINMNDSKKIRIMFNIFIVLIILFNLFILFTFLTCINFINRGCH